VAKGLPDVEQKISVDADDAVKGYKEGEEGARAYARAADDAEDSIRDLAAAHDDAARRVGDLNREIRDQLRALSEYSETYEEVSDAIRDQADAMNALRDMYGNMGSSAARVTAEQHAIAQSFLEIQRTGEGAIRAGADHISVIDAMASKMGVLGAATRSYNDDVAALESSLGGAADASNQMILAGMRAADDYKAKIDSALAAASAAGAAIDVLARSSGGGGAPVVDAAIASALAGGGGGGFVNWALQRGDYSGGGGNNGITRFMMMGSSDIAAGTAALGRIWPIVHWTVMGLAELAAVGVPAAIAGGAAAYVGLQGAMNVANRVQAGYAVTEALGGAYGVTGGQIYGLGTSIQQAQNISGDPLVYQAVGGLLTGLNRMNRSVAAAGGESFAQMGTGVLQTMDAFISRMTAEVGSQKVGKQMAQLGSVAQDDLTEFGQVFGNLGHFLVNAASNMPGLSEWLLKGLTGITGFMSDVAGSGLPFTVAMGAEESWRWGGAIGGLLSKAVVSPLANLASGAGSLLGGVPLLGGLLGSRGASAADREALAKGLGKDVGDLTAEDLAGIGGEGAGLAGLLGTAADFLTGPLGWLAIGGGVGLGIGIDKLLTAQTPAQAQVSQWQKALAAAGPVQSLSLISGQMAAARSAAAQSLATAAQQNFQGGLQFLPGAAGTARAAAGTYGAYPAELAQYAAGVAQGGVQISKDFGVGIPEALALFQEAGLTKYKGGLLTTNQLGQIADTIRGYEAMTAGQGALGASINAVSAASALQNTQVSTRNSSLDTLSQNAAGGTSNLTAMYSVLQNMGISVGQATLPAHGKGATSAQMEAAARANDKNVQAVADALTSFTSPTSVAAWQAFSGQGSTPSFLSTAQSATDWLRTMMASGVLQGSPAAEMAAYTARQGLAVAEKSPVALSQLSTLIQPFGGPAYQAGESLKQNVAAISGWLDKTAGSSAEFNKNFQQTSIAGSNIGQIASNLTDNLQQAAASGFAQSFADQITTSVDALDKTLGPGGTLSKGSFPSIESLGKELKNAGFQAGDIKAFLGEALSLKGFSPKEVSSAIAGLPKSVQIALGFDVKKPDIPKIPDQSYEIEGRFHVPPIPKIPDQSFNIIGHVSIAGGIATGTIPGGPGGLRLMAQHGFLVPGSGHGDIVPAMLEPGEAVIPKHLVGALAPFLAAHKVPGFQSGGLAGEELGDTLVQASSMISSFGNSGSWSAGQWGQMSNTFLRAANLSHVMGSMAHYATGGIVPAATLSGVKAQLDAEWQQLDALYAQEDAASGSALASLKSQVDAFWSNIMDPLYAAEDRLEGKTAGTAAAPSSATWQSVIKSFEKTLTGEGAPWAAFGREILDGLIAGVKNAPETAKLAQSLVNKVTTEVNYARSVSSAAAQGQGYSASGSSGLLSTFGDLATPVMTAQGKPYQYYIDQQNAAATGGTLSVQQQMSDYLQAEKSFAADLGKLSKGGLNKSLLSQLAAAGPLQGDELAQSILGGPGGIGAANKLQSEIGKASQQLGISAAEGVYGYGGKSVKVTADTTAAQAAINEIHGKTVAIIVDLKVTGGGGGGVVPLTPAQIKQVGQQVQSYLLEQAKRNRKTGIQLPGYGT
jgi:hypothetical protein